MIKTASVKMGDGNDYVVSSFNVGDFIDLEKKYGSLQLESTKLEPIMYWFWLAIRKNHKDMTIEKLYELVDTEFMANNGIAKMFDTMNSLNGWGTTEKNAVSPAKAQ
jgi:hypothetical protein